LEERATRDWVVEGERMSGEGSLEVWGSAGLLVGLVAPVAQSREEDGLAVLASTAAESGQVRKT
jgi:hypothetical protein